MSSLDWIVMLGTLLLIVTYGIWKSRGSKDIKGYLLGDKKMKWWTIGLSVMATQASAITFLSTPGQGFADGMRFVQFYFGLPLAMVIIAVVFIPLYYKLKVYTAYEFLEKRFDRKTRVFTAILFLIQRGLAAGITIYAPAIILCQILGWSLNFTILFIGVLVIIYTVSGGTKAVSQTHKTQMAVIFGGMFIAFGVLVWYINQYISFGQAIEVAGKLGKMNIIDLEFDLNNRYTLWSGLIGGLFLQLSYFGTDQSQVQRYISGASIKESKIGLMFNGLVKVPMQFFILLTGVLVFVFYQFYAAPIHFNQVAVDNVKQSQYAEDFNSLESDYVALNAAKKVEVQALADALSINNDEEINRSLEKVKSSLNKEAVIREKATEAILNADPEADTDDTDFVFITFIINFLPIGIVGLLMAVIFSAAMSSTSAELNALASTSTVDIYKRNFKQEGSDKHFVSASKLFTLLFGITAILFAFIASSFENLIEAVNIIGSLFYGTILGVFLTAFFLKWVKGNAVFIAAGLAEVIVIVVYMTQDISYLWLNFIGCGAVMLISMIIEKLVSSSK